MIPRPMRSLAAIALAAGILAAPAGIVPSRLAPAGLPGPSLGAVTVSAAIPDLTLVTDARYVVQPDKSRVHIVLDITAANHTKDTITRRFYYEDAYLAVLPGTSRFTITGDGVNPSVRVRSRAKAYTVLAISFGRKLYSGQELALRLAFDLPDPGGAPTREVRIGPSLVTFPAWAFASDSTPGSSVTVIFPSGYTILVRPNDWPPPTTSANGSVVFRSGPLAHPLDFYAYFSADRAAALVPSTLTTTVGGIPVELTLRRWAEDEAWAERIGDLFGRGLPVLGGAIGLPYPPGEPLVVEESASRTIGGYAGLYDPDVRTIQVAYNADPFVALHEAAHAWFNGSLLADRWANEAFASYYATEAAGALDVPVRAEPLTPELEEARIPLNAWGAVGREESSVEDYGYAASLELATLIGERAGPGALQDVWSAVATGEAAYQPIDRTRPRERSDAGPPDWRGLLDLLEERTGVTFDDVWIAWVVRPDEAKLLQSRREARARYAATVRAAGEWELAPTMRRAMDAWQFDQAEELMSQALEALDGWRELEQTADSAGVSLPSTVRDAFESPTGPGAALGEIRAEEAVIGDIAETAAIGLRRPDLFESIGLAGTEPESDLAAAMAALAGGNLDAALEQAAAARTTWTRAADVGRERVLLGLLAVGIVGGTSAVVASTVVRRRREERAVVTAATALGPADRGDPYDTLD